MDIDNERPLGGASNLGWRPIERYHLRKDGISTKGEVQASRQAKKELVQKTNGLLVGEQKDALKNGVLLARPYPWMPKEMLRRTDEHIQECNGLS